MSRHRQDYVLMKRIAGAQGGAVFKVRLRRGGELRALKIMRKDTLTAEGLKAARAEGDLLTELRHPHVLQLLAAFEDEECVYLESEYLAGGELFHVIAKRQFFEEHTAQQVMHTLLAVVAHLHAHGVGHRDIKPENLVLAAPGDLSTLRLIDFGAAHRFEGSAHFRDFFGTAYYMAPEIFARDSSEKVDVWACGVIAYILLCGMPPFNGATDAQIYERILDGPPAFGEAAWSFVSAEAKAFVLALLTRDAANRPGAAQALQLAWVCDPELSRGGPRPADVGGVLPQMGSLCALSSLQRLMKLAIAHRREKDAQQLPACNCSTDAESPCIASRSDIRQLIEQIDHQGSGRIESAHLARLLSMARDGPAAAGLAQQLAAQPFLSHTDILALWDKLSAP